MFKANSTVFRFCFSLTGMILISGVVLWTSCSQKSAEPTGTNTASPPTVAKEITTGTPSPAAQTESKANPVERGKYLVTVMACQDCHSPHDKDGDIIKGKEWTGHWKDAPVPKWNEEIQSKNTTFMAVGADFTAFAGPWGISKAKNLTPDPDTGIGKLTEEQFVDLFKRGSLMPPMPLQWMNQMKEEDLKAIYAYLRTLPPVNNGSVEEVKMAN